MVFARSCGTLLSTLTLVMILKHNNTQHRLTAEETEVFTHQVGTVGMTRASIICYWSFSVHLRMSCSHTNTVSLHVSLRKKAFSLCAHIWCSVGTIAVNFFDVCWLSYYWKIPTCLCNLTKEIRLMPMQSGSSSPVTWLLHTHPCSISIKRMYEVTYITPTRTSPDSM